MHENELFTKIKNNSNLGSKIKYGFKLRPAVIQSVRRLADVSKNDNGLCLGHTSIR